MGCSPWGYKESGTTERLTLTYLHVSIFPGGSVGKEFAYNARDSGSIPGSGRSPQEENGNPFQYSLAWRFPRTEELAADSPWDPKESDMTV